MSKVPLFISPELAEAINALLTEPEQVRSLPFVQFTMVPTAQSNVPAVPQALS